MTPNYVAGAVKLLSDEIFTIVLQHCLFDRFAVSPLILRKKQSLQKLDFFAGEVVTAL